MPANGCADRSLTMSKRSLQGGVYTPPTEPPRGLKARRLERWYDGTEFPNQESDRQHNNRGWFAGVLAVKLEYAMLERVPH